MALLCPREKYGKSLGLGVSHGHQTVVRDDEGDRRRGRNGLLDGVDDIGGHVDRGILDVEAVRSLDLAHLGPCGHRNAQGLLDGCVLLRRRVEEVDPDGRRRDRIHILGGREAVTGDVIKCQHSHGPLLEWPNVRSL